MDNDPTYMLTFYTHSNTIDHVREFHSDGEARAIMNKYNVIDSGDYYSRIALSRVDPKNPSVRIKIAELSF